MNKLLNSNRKEYIIIFKFYIFLQCKEYGKILIVRPLSLSLQNIITAGLFVIILTSAPLNLVEKALYKWIIIIIILHLWMKSISSTI